MKNIKSLKILALLSLSLSSFSANSQAITFETSNIKIATTGVHNLVSYFRIVEPLEAKCAYGVIYIASEKKLLYTQLLMAKASGGKILRLNYTLTNGPNSECLANIIEME